MVSTENTETLRNWVRRGCIMWAVCMPRKWDCTRKTFWIPAEILGSETRFDISNIYISFLKENVKGDFAKRKSCNNTHLRLNTDHFGCCLFCFSGALYDAAGAG